MSINYRLCFLAFFSFLVIFIATPKLWYELPPQESSNVNVKQFHDHRHPRLEFSDFYIPFGRDGRSLRVSKEGVAYVHDPRLLPSLWLNLINENTEPGYSAINSLPFQWSSVLDMSAYFGNEVELSTSLSSVKGHKRSSGCKWLDSKPVILGPINRPLSEKERAFVGASYLLHLQTFRPSTAILMGVEPESVKFLIVNLTFPTNRNLFSKSVLATLIERYKYCYGEAEGISLRKEIQNTQNLLKSSLESSQSSCDWNCPLIPQEDFSYPYDISSFENNSLKLNELTDELDRKVLENVVSSLNSSEKYFNEASIVGNYKGFHFDWRFFKRAYFSPFEHRMILHRMTRAWLRFSRKACLISWLAHGSLLGWYWNGLNFPWDEDVDAQMTSKGLFELARNYNQTIIVDYTYDEDASMSHMYFIDVSPHFMNLRNENGTNNIDARFIDLATGMYVDITALSVTEMSSIVSSEADRNLYKLFDPEYTEKMHSAALDVHMRDYRRQLETLQNDALSIGAIVNSKDKHYYCRSDLVPLVKTSFEGEEALVPANFKAILKCEYKNGLLFKHYRNWSFRPYLGIWVPQNVAKGDYYGKECDDEDTVLESIYTESLRLKRGDWLPKFTKSRVDPFIVHRNQHLVQAS